MENPILKIDFRLLDKQKNGLLEVIESDISDEHRDNLNGILYLIDSIQDYAVSELGKTEKEVFNF